MVPPVAEKGLVVVTGVAVVAAETAEADEGTAAGVVGHPRQRKAGWCKDGPSQSVPAHYILLIHMDDTKQRKSHAISQCSQKDAILQIRVDMM
jgi:hypothetical protein